MEEIIYFWIAPIVTTAAGGFLLYAVQHYFYVWGRLKFRNYPNVEGTYKASYDDLPPDEEAIITVKQTGGRVYGTIFNPSKNLQLIFKGFVTESRLVSYQFHPRSKNINSYGSGLLKLNKYLTGAEGYVLIVDDQNDKPSSTKVILTQVPKNKN